MNPATIQIGGGIALLFLGDLGTIISRQWGREEIQNRRAPLITRLRNWIAARRRAAAIKAEREAFRRYMSRTMRLPVRLIDENYKPGEWRAEGVDQRR